jgi:hypothetical protein
MKALRDGADVRRQAALRRLLHDIQQLALAWIARLYITMLLGSFHVARQDKACTHSFCELPWLVALSLGVYS